MKSSNWLVLAATLLLLTVKSALVLAVGPEVTGRSGDVNVSSSSASLSVGDKVKTGADGEIVLQVKESGLRLLVASNSEVFYQGVTAAGAQNFKVAKGKVRFSIVPGNHLDVETPHLVASVRGTEFSTTVEDQASELSVSEGRVEVRDSKGGTGLIARGWNAVATASGFTSETNARLSKMSTPRENEGSIEKERVKKTEDADKPEPAKHGANDSGADSGKGKSGGDSGGKSGGDSGGKSGGDSGGKSGGDSGGKSGGDSGGKSGGNSGGKSGGNSGGGKGK